jgi:asparagine synthase (glutamine-hydrolysing)
MRLKHWARIGRTWSPGQAYCGHRWLMFPPSDLAGLVAPEAFAHADLLVRGWTAALEDSRSSLLKRMQQVDATTYLPGAVLAKLDRMSMAFALEVRCPLLSRRVAAFAQDLGTDLCFRDGVGKLVLRHLAAKYLPEDHLRRPKMGFGLPGGAWSQSEMLAMCDRLVLGDDSRTGAVLDAGGLRAFVDGQRRPGRFSVFQIWTLLILELWLRAQEGGRASEGSWGTTPSCFAAV